MKKILVIEDEPVLSKSLADNLAKEGLEVLRAMDGEEGLAMALSSHPDLILLDILLPKMDGLTVLDKIREDSWGKSVPIIILSNLSQPEYVAEAIENVNEYLVKVDLKIEDIIKKIKERLKM